MRNVLRIVMAAALVAAVSPSVLAFAAPVPDGGATALLVALGAGGILAADKFLRRK
jgi:hypothetical protein